MEKEKGCGRHDMITTIAAAIKNAAQRGANVGQELKIEINPRTGALKAWKLLRIVYSVSDPALEIHISKASEWVEDPKLEEFVEQEMDPAYLGRIAAQTARQAIMQRIRQFEKERIFDDFKDQVGDIVTGTVRRRERGDLIVDLGKAEAILPPRERVPGEDYAPGERIRCLLSNIETSNRGPDLILSRGSPKFVRRLFELEVAEIADGTVTIRSMAREPGYRTKISVDSTDPKVDPVGACVGARGARVKSIVRELGGEKIDIIRHYDDPIAMLEEALKPAIPKNIKLDQVKHLMYFEVAEDDLSVAIGRRGQNARLTSRLLGWKLDIAKEEVRKVGFDERMGRAEEGLAQIPGLDQDLASRLVNCGFVSPEVFDGVTAQDLMGIGFNEEESNLILEKVNAFFDSVLSQRQSNGALSAAAC